MTTRRILATSGGFLAMPSMHENIRRPGGLFLDALRLSGKERPRVLFVMTASADNANYLAMSYQACRDLAVDLDHLVVFPYPNQPVDEAFGRADVVWVGGGILDDHGAPLGETLHVTERFAQPDPDTLTDTFTIEDPQALTRPYTATKTFKRNRSIQMMEYVCEENNRNPVDANGVTGVKLINR